MVLKLSCWQIQKNAAENNHLASLRYTGGELPDEFASAASEGKRLQKQARIKDGGC